MNKDNYFILLVFIIFLFLGFGFPITVIHCDKSENVCKVGRPFYRIPNIQIFREKYKQFNTIEINKIEKVKKWQGYKHDKLGYNIGFYMKNSNKNTFYGNENGDVHIIAYSIFEKPAQEFCENFNNFIQNESVKDFSKTFYPEWVIETAILLILALIFRFNYVIKNRKIIDGILTIIFCSVIFSIPVVFITLMISFFK